MRWVRLSCKVVCHAADYDLQQYNATFEFTSKLGDVTLVLLDNYDQRNEILTTFHQHTRAWLSAALAASPLEVAGLLQDYLDDNTTFEMSESSGMGKSVALDIAKMMPQSAREGKVVERRMFKWRSVIID